ncbi:hypothetical protein [Natrinema gelatinilyticum]|uniref:hypothetical protein n=1 Tax=Natrinema gelatinilyticum TaxID=2961571 RepID=UPI0020C29963|nr:hypothetical protein [Natrinema gelatinilyticum]
MIQREQLVELGLAVVMFLIGALVYVIPDWNVGIVVLVLALSQLVRVHLTEDWAILDTSVGIWLLVLGVITMISPVWGVPLLFITGGVQLVRALGHFGMAIDLSLVALVGYTRNAPLWAVALLVAVAVGKVLFLLRDYFEKGRSSQSQPA